eukprot:scaffold207710_cov20-Tisochrysis_lutea.AAC.2
MGGINAMHDAHETGGISKMYDAPARCMRLMEWDASARCMVHMKRETSARCKCMHRALKQMGRIPDVRSKQAPAKSCVIWLLQAAHSCADQLRKFFLDCFATGVSGKNSGPEDGRTIGMLGFLGDIRLAAVKEIYLPGGVRAHAWSCTASTSAGCAEYEYEHGLSMCQYNYQVSGRLRCFGGRGGGTVRREKWQSYKAGWPQGVANKLEADYQPVL